MDDNSEQIKKLVDNVFSAAVPREPISLRDFFAGLAMQALIAGKHTADEKFDGKTIGHACAATAYGYADAMLAQREKK